MSDEQERWMPVVGYEGRYEVSDRGGVRSLGITDARGREYPARVLKPKGARYLSVHLSGNGRKTQHAVHRLVLAAFVGPGEPGQEVRHLNDVSFDNRLENLAWGTRKENSADKFENGGQPLGEGVGSAKLTANDVIEIRARVAAGETRTSVAKSFGISRGTLWALIEGRTWGHV